MENRHVFYPGEPLEEGAMRVTLLGTGTPFPRRGQAAAGMADRRGFLLRAGRTLAAELSRDPQRLRAILREMTA